MDDADQKDENLCGNEKLLSIFDDGDVDILVVYEESSNQEYFD
jgi:hypothetical protein